MRETLYAEVDLTDAVVDLVKQGHYSGVSVAIFGPTHPSNPKPGHHYLPDFIVWHCRFTWLARRTHQGSK